MAIYINEREFKQWFATINIDNLTTLEATRDKANLAITLQDTMDVIINAHSERREDERTD